MKLKIIFLLILTPLIARDIYFTRSGNVSFFSSTPIEDIKAINDQMTCVLDIETGEVSFRIPILGFNFPNGLMQEHFNENYMESDIYPNASFKGRVQDWGEINLTEESQDITIDGIMKIHGVSKKISEKGIISFLKGNVVGNAKFQIMVADYGIEIPKLVREKIAKIVNVNIELVLKKK
ncbi:MAG: YceI family protein [Candidatus Neomarinimicrobiota bacterium]|tara:strand:+ start:1397 stop:1933 length:537 start_codon:yes stop_codon:yes gene_type:complete